MKLSTILFLTMAAAVPSASQRGTIRNIETRLMAPCCYTQMIDVHESEIAQQMRSEVTEMVMEGKSEPEILTYYKTEYGESILAVPDGRTGTVAFAIPIIVLPTAALLLFAGIRKRGSVRPQLDRRFQNGLEPESLHNLYARIREESSWP